MKALLPIAFIALATAFFAPGITACGHGGHAAMQGHAPAEDGGHAAMEGHAPAEDGGHAAMQTQAPAEARMVEGVVEKVDKSSGKVILSHGPLVNLGMPGMTMGFQVKDVVWLDQMKEGDKIRFMADNVNGALTVVHFETAP